SPSPTYLRRFCDTSRSCPSPPREKSTTSVTPLSPRRAVRAGEFCASRGKLAASFRDTSRSFAPRQERKNCGEPLLPRHESVFYSGHLPSNPRPYPACGKQADEPRYLDRRAPRAAPPPGRRNLRSLASSPRCHGNRWLLRQAPRSEPFHEGVVREPL